MREYVSGLFFILDSRKYTDDIAFLSISPFEGQQTIIVKGGNRETSKRGKSLDIGNTIKAKLYKRHHFYLTEADIVESFSFLKRHLTTIVLYQILLTVLKHTYYLPERQFFFSIHHTLLELNESGDLERAELGLFLLIMKILNYYNVCTFPIVCQVCSKITYKGNFDYLGFYCDEHMAKNGQEFSFFSTKERIDFLKTILLDSLSIKVTFNPAVAE
jgi:hypothetical protein